MKLKKKFYFLSLLLFFAISIFLYNAKEVNQSAITIAFYNVENLFDTINDPHAHDDDFLPHSKLQWNKLKYEHKLHNLSEVIDKLGDENGPEILGMSEVENDEVLKDLLHTSTLKKKHYKFIHKESEDRRGIDVAFLYKPEYFKPFVIQSYAVNFPFDKNSKTRNILLVGGILEKDTVYFFVNHWPSRRGGAKESEFKRITAAERLKGLIDSIQRCHKNPKLILMGDFNDKPSNKSIAHVLNASNKHHSTELLFNPFTDLDEAGEGTIKFKGHWDTFDQIIFSKNFFKDKSHPYIENSAQIFDPNWLHYKENPKNGPWRTYSGYKYYGGFSDHFPVWLHFGSVKY